MASRRYLKDFHVISQENHAGDAPGAASFESLPTALQLVILLHLPLVQRVRAGLVSHRWAALAHEPLFWSELDFDGAVGSELDDSILLDLTRRAKGTLRSFDVSSPACDNVQLSLGPSSSSGAPLLVAAASESLTQSLRSLAVWRPGKVRHRSGRLRLRRPADSLQLLSLCPMLSSAAMDLDGKFPDVLSALLLLPPVGTKRLCLTVSAQTDAEAFCVELAAAISARPVDKLEVIGQGSAGPFLLIEQQIAAGGADGGDTTAGLSEETPAAQLGAALACPDHGPRVFRSSDAGFGSSPVLAHL